MPPRPQPSPAKSRLRLGLALILLIAAAGAALWTWHQNTRPGAVALQKGLDAAAAQQFPEAEQDWLDGVRQDPGFAPCYDQLGDLYMDEKRFPEARAQYQAAAKLTPDDGMLFLKLNRADLATNDVAGARATAKRAAELRPTDPDAVGLYGTLEASYDDRPVALSALRRAHQMRPDDRDYLISLVQLEMKLQDMAPAEQDLAPWLQAHPQDALACHLMAVIDEQKPQTPANVQGMIALEQRARAGMPGDMRVYITLGELDLEANRPADALRAYQEGLRIDKNSEEMLHGLVTAYTRLGQTQQATAVDARLVTETARHQRITRLQDLTRMSPSNVPLALQLASLAEQDSNFALAGDTYVSLVRLAPRDPRARAALAAFYRRIGRADLARQAARPDYVP